MASGKFGNGGVATSAGIEFQAATGAVFCVLLLTNENSSILDAKGPSGLVDSVSFEQVSAVDDIVVRFESGSSVALQAKRGLALSDKTDSEFAKVIRQFANDHAGSAGSGSRLALAVSPRASAGIRDILRRLLDRLRELPSQEGVAISKEEKQAWGSLRKLAAAELAKQGKPVSDEAVDSLIRRIHVLCIDPEDGGTDIRMALALLRSRMNIEPLLVWRAIIATCLDACKRRGTITRSTLETAFGKFAISPQATPEQTEKAFFSVAAAEASSGSYGRDLVVVERPFGIKERVAGVMELYRFDDGGQRRYRFDRTQLFLGGDAPPSRVFARASTWSGINRMLLDIPELQTQDRVVMMPINGDSEIHDKSTHAQAHRALCATRIETRIGHLRCLHCGEPISDQRADIVEIDNEGDSFDAGPIHVNCRRAVDRVVGHIQLPRFEEYPHLVNFDLAGFARAIRQGQISVRMASHSKASAVLGWNRNFRKSLNGPYCIELQLLGNAPRYVTERVTLRRYTQAEATARAEWLTKQLEDAKKRRDPWCYTSLTGLFGPYSLLESQREPTEHCVECLRAVAVPYTAQIGSQFEDTPSYYAPLLALRESSNGEWINLDGVVPLIREPFSIEQLVKNWTTANKIVPSFVCSLLANDSEFDHLVETVLSREQQVVIDPLFDASGKPIGGIPVRATPDEAELSAGWQESTSATKTH